MPVSEKGRGADEAVEILGVPHVAGVHRDEGRHEVVGSGPLVVARLGRDRARVHPVRDHAQTLRRRSLRLEPLPHGFADGDDPVGTPQVRADETAQNADDRRVAEAVELGRDLREHVLADDEHRHAEATAERDAHVTDDRRIGHAQHEIRGRTAQGVRERRAEVGEVVRRTSRELRALVRRGGDADDPDAVVLVLAGRVLVAVQDARDDLDLVVLRERLAELGQEMCGRLDPWPVVLVEDENSPPSAVGRHAARLAVSDTRSCQETNVGAAARSHVPSWD